MRIGVRRLRNSAEGCRLRPAGCGLDDVVQCTVYLVGVDHWPAFNAIYARIFGAHKPVRAVVPVPALHFGFLVEVQLVAQLARQGPGDITR